MAYELQAAKTKQKIKEEQMQIKVRNFTPVVVWNPIKVFVLFHMAFFGRTCSWRFLLAFPAPAFHEWDEDILIELHFCDFTILPFFLSLVFYIVLFYKLSFRETNLELDILLLPVREKGHI